MRIFDSIFRSTALSSVFADLTEADGVGPALRTNETDCSNREIRLWLHIVLTGSFTGWRKSSRPELKKVFTHLTQEYPNLNFGASGFGDRPSPSYKAAGKVDNECYVPGADFSDAFGDDMFDKFAQMTLTEEWSYLDDEEDPLSAMPWIAKNKFGDYTGVELRIFSMITDYGPHYGPEYDRLSKSGNTEPDFPSEDFVNCDTTKRYATLD